jgi:hypothetical protein
VGDDDGVDGRVSNGDGDNAQKKGDVELGGKSLP